MGGEGSGEGLLGGGDCCVVGSGDVWTGPDGGGLFVAAGVEGELLEGVFTGDGDVSLAPGAGGLGVTLLG